MAKAILVTGGAGYIGSFMVGALIEKGYMPVIIDNLSGGAKRPLEDNAAFYEGSIADRDLVIKIMQEHPIDGVIHFAGHISMKESMENPSLYFEGNTFDTLKFLNNLREINVNNIIFSSTAGVYGNPQRVPIGEDDQKKPTNPYGESKLMVEKLLSWYKTIYGLNYVVLRYFNACGAALDGRIGEQHNPETHIIPLAIKALLENREFAIMGTDYSTPDGTCVRDYVHVLDLAQAHILALEKVMEFPGGYTYNVGTGKGYSNREVVKAIEDVTGRKLNIVEKDRRPGDADTLVADVTKIRAELGFVPKYSDIKTIIESAWKWHSSKP